MLRVELIELIGIQDHLKERRPSKNGENMKTPQRKAPPGVPLKPCFDGAGMVRSV